MDLDMTQRTTPLTPLKPPIDVDAVRADFPILSERINGHRLVYLDNAATSQKPRSVINAHIEFYRKQNANIHRGLHTLAEQSTAAYEATRDYVAKFVGGVKREEVIFTSGATEAINLVARSWGDTNIKAGDEILITDMEHHANLVPWVMLAQRTQAVLRRIPITICGHLDLSALDRLLTEKTRMVALTQMSNVLGTINPVREIVDKAHQVGAVVLVDGAQSVPHMPVDFADLGADFLAFSSHKMLGPTGVGVLVGRESILDAMPPFMMGGEMISQVSYDKITWADLPHKFEAGTPNIAGVVTFKAALEYLDALGMDAVRWHEVDLTAYALRRISEVEGIDIQGPTDATERGGAISFTDKDIHPHDISTFLDSRGIAIRAGHHCAQPLVKSLGKVATARASLYIYNNERDIDVLVDTLGEMRRYFGV